MEDGALARLAGAPGPDGSDQADAVLAGDLLFERYGEVAAVDEVLLRQQIPITEVGQDAGQGLGVVDGGLGGGHVGDHAGGVLIAGLGDVCEEPLPAGLAAAGVAGADVVGRDDGDRRGWQAGVLGRSKILETKIPDSVRHCADASVGAAVRQPPLVPGDGVSRP